MIKTIICGAAGRMGRRLVYNVLENSNFTLCGAVEYQESPFIGQDAGVVAGTSKANVNIVGSINEVVSGSDVAIIFATNGAIEMVRTCINNGVAVVLGTTGLGSSTKEELAALGKKGKIVYATNMSVGVNLLFKLAEITASLLGEDYDIEICEMHHRHKKDAPSGTAVTLAETVARVRGLSYEKDVQHGRVGQIGERPVAQIGMHSLRGGDVVGDHTITFATEGERVELTHRASSRDTFVHGALRAALFLKDVPNGLYDMRDVLNLKD